MKSILYCEVMDTPETRQQGLQHVMYLPWDHGALFIFSENNASGFWMKNTPIPLELIYMDKNYNVISVHDLRPHNTQVVECSQPYKYALEVNPGWCEAHGIYPSVNFHEVAHLEFI